MRGLLALKRHISISAIQSSCNAQRFYSSRFCVKDVSTVTYALNLAECLRSSILGTQIHGLKIKLGLSNDIFSQNNSVKMYMKCGMFSDARKLFDEMPERNLVSWTLIMSGANKNGDYRVAVELFIGMMRTEYFMPNEYALGSIMKAGINMGAVEFCLCIHCVSVKIGLENNDFVGSSILHMYSKYGAIEEAERLFQSLNGSDLGTWNTMVGGYAQCGYGFKAINTVSSMHSKGVRMDEFTFIHALNACSITSNLDFGSQIHGQIVRNGYEAMITLMNSLIDMYFKTDAKDQSWKIFETMEDKDIASWNTILALSPVQQVVCLFNDLMATGLKPNRITFTILFRTCGDALVVNLGQQFFGLAVRLGLHDEPRISNCLINMFCRFDMKATARSIFDSLPLKDIKNWNEMIHGYNWSCDLEAIKLFVNLRGSTVEPDECTFSCAIEACFKTENVQIGRQVHAIIIKSGFASNEYVCTSLVHGYTKSGFLTDSYAFFDEKMDIASWSSLISGLVDKGYTNEVIRVFIRLKEDQKNPDEFIFGSILNACATIASLNLTKSIHGQVFRVGLDTNAYVTSALLDAYGKSGDITSATVAFHDSCVFADVALFNTMITAYANHGRVMEAMEVYEMMKVANLKPIQSTFVSVLSACSHAGLVDVGRMLFRSIVVDYKMDPSPDNYGCLVDLLSRNGFLEEAKEMIEGMPYPSWPGIWRSFVNGCRIHGENEFGKMGAKKLLELFPKEKSEGYVLLSKIYCEEGNWEDGWNVRKEMVDKGIRKDLGSSWISV
ncbi:hypothetical protein L1887_30088 [Cichorium endivia]|nr:hypothetical protein L1887_30088 [Cichorium endivia]